MVDEIRLENVEEKDGTLLNQDGLGCQLCLTKASKYTCPRCSVKYCSLECYKGEKHLKCSEEFYKKCVMEALQDETCDSKGRLEMMKILERQREEEVDGEGDVVGEGGETGDLEERLEGLNLDKDSEKVWEKLTDDERREFEKAVDTGYIGSLVDAWEPWWIEHGERSETLDEAEDILSFDNNSTPATLPKILKNISKLDTLLKSKQPCLDTKYNLINILYSYAYICRFYNGCYLDFTCEAVEGMWKLSNVLFQNVNFSSVDSVLRSSVEASQQHRKFYNSVEFSLSVITDVSVLLKSTTGVHNLEHFVKLALSDMYKLFGKGITLYKSLKAKGDANGNGSLDNGSLDLVKSLWLAKKKVYFVLAWFCENEDICLSLEPFLPVVAEAITIEFKQHEDEKRKIEKSRYGKKLIEEIY